MLIQISLQLGVSCAAKWVKSINHIRNWRFFRFDRTHKKLSFSMKTGKFSWSSKMIIWLASTVDGVHLILPLYLQRPMVKNYTYCWGIWDGKRLQWQWYLRNYLVFFLFSFFFFLKKLPSFGYDCPCWFSFLEKINCWAFCKFY